MEKENEDLLDTLSNGDNMILYIITGFISIIQAKTITQCIIIFSIAIFISIVFKIIIQILIERRDKK